MLKTGPLRRLHRALKEDATRLTHSQPPD
jgi:hypothetical protein